ncbi:MAG: ribonuclease III [Candidatus Saccharibacteria bacterium]|nr:ribonuclease III [Candidatus Saccharibacteria bacterium]
MYYNVGMPKAKQQEYQDFAREHFGFEFNDISLFITALTHKSYAHEHKILGSHNERLEFLGDAILEVVTSDYLFRNYSLPEGIMTGLRSALVNTESIGDASEKLGYLKLTRLGHGEGSRTVDHAHPKFHADCFEAVVGAIYLDQGYNTALQFINKHIIVKLPEILENETWRDPKSLLQEISQRLYAESPIYQLVTMSGPDHDRSFTMRVIVNGTVYGIGSGHSKQDATIRAAQVAVRRLKDEGLYKPKVFKKIKSV